MATTAPQVIVIKMRKGNYAQMIKVYMVFLS